DGIRDLTVTGVQTCALPISAELQLKYPPFSESETAASNIWTTTYTLCDIELSSFLGNVGALSPLTKFLVYSRGTDPSWTNESVQIGRASCRERVGSAVGGGR